MRRTCRRVLIGLALSAALLGLPGLAQAAPPAASAAVSTSAGRAPAVAAPAAAAPVVAAPAVVQEPQPGPDLDSGPTDQRSRQDIAIGLGGVALIGLVLFSRRARKKPVLFVKWKK